MKAKSSGWLLAGVACALGPMTGMPAAQAQTATDGAIAGQVLDTAGAPVAGALVEARELETGLVLRSLSGTRGEFLVVRLPVGEYEVTVEDAGAALTLPGQVEVGLGEVTEITARLRAAAAGQPGLPDRNQWRRGRAERGRPGCVAGEWRRVEFAGADRARSEWRGGGG